MKQIVFVLQRFDLPAFLIQLLLPFSPTCYPQYPIQFIIIVVVFVLLLPFLIHKLQNCNSHPLLFCISISACSFISPLSGWERSPAYSNGVLLLLLRRWQLSVIRPLLLVAWTRTWGSSSLLTLVRFGLFRRWNQRKRRSCRSITTGLWSLLMSAPGKVLLSWQTSIGVF